MKDTLPNLFGSVPWSLPSPALPGQVVAALTLTLLVVLPLHLLWSIATIQSEIALLHKSCSHRSVL